jgi:hypothetical protein
MLAASAPPDPVAGVADLTMAEVDAELPAAIDRLAAMLSLDAAQVALLESATIKIGDLPNNGLGLTDITLSPNADGWGWFVDPSPETDGSLSLVTAQGLTATPGSAASGKMDLLPSRCTSSRISSATRTRRAA